MRHPNKSTIWMSKKMAEKSKEVSWQRLSLERKKDYDMAEAKELSNVLQAKALRTLTQQEWAELDHIMGMRWVLTSKSDGSAKSRLVALGYQATNLTQVQASAPTMSRLSRNFLLIVPTRSSGFAQETLQALSCRHPSQLRMRTWWFGLLQS